jgi:membrane protease YdiL (CAAX protease family)
MVKARSAKFTDAVLFVAVFLVSEILLATFVAPLIHVGARWNLFVAAQKIIALALVYLVIRKRLRGNRAANISFVAAPVAACLLVAAGVMGIHLFLQPIEAFLGRALPIYQYYGAQANAGYRPNDIVGTILVFIVLGPVTEELLFRGVILQGFLENYQVPLALLLSSALFGLFHHNPAQFIGPVFSGILFGAAYLRTRSVFPCIAGHVLTNGIWFVARADRTASELLALGARGDEPVLLLVRGILGLSLATLSILLLVLPGCRVWTYKEAAGSEETGAFTDP